jgi:hypothetical protein
MNRDEAQEENHNTQETQVAANHLAMNQAVVLVVPGQVDDKNN